MTSPPAAPKLGIIAGGGQLPLRLASAAQEANREIHILAIEGWAGPEIERYPHTRLPIGALGHAIRTLKDTRCKEVVIAGIVKRPDFSQLKPDWRGATVIPKLVAAAREGDDALLRVLVQEFEKEGFKVVGAQSVFGGLVARSQVMTRAEPAERDRQDIARAIEIVRALGRLDIGQGAVVCEGLVLAVEAAEGTDAMLDRCAVLPAEIRGSSEARRGVLVKLAKPIQERRIDLPTIGVATVERAARAGLAGIAVEAGGALIIDETATIARADELGLFIAGVSPSQGS